MVRMKNIIINLYLIGYFQQLICALLIVTQEVVIGFCTRINMSVY